MTRQKLLSRYAKLSKRSQRLVDQLLERLVVEETPSASRPQHKSKPSPPKADAFFGLWRDREDMADPTAWVRRLRESERKRRIG